MKEKLMKSAKFVGPVVGIVARLAIAFLEDRELDEKVAKKVAETLAKTNGKES